MAAETAAAAAVTPTGSQLGGLVTAAQAAKAREEAGTSARAAPLRTFDERTDPTRKLNDKFRSEAEIAHRDLRQEMTALRVQLAAAFRDRERAIESEAQAREHAAAAHAELSGLQSQRAEIEEAIDLLDVFAEAGRLLAAAGLADFPPEES